MNYEVILHQGEDVRRTKVIRRNVEPDSEVIGDYKNTLMLNTILYDVQFPDGAIKPYSENLIAEKILTQVDADGYHNQLLKGILDRSNDKLSLEKKDQWIITKRGILSMRKTTFGWKFHMKWKYVTITWKFLKDLKESNPIEVTEYVTARSIQDEPSFSWWVPFTLRKLDK